MTRTRVGSDSNSERRSSTANNYHKLSKQLEAESLSEDSSANKIEELDESHMISVIPDRIPSYSLKSIADALHYNDPNNFSLLRYVNDSNSASESDSSLSSSGVSETSECSSETVNNNNNNVKCTPVLQQSSNQLKRKITNDLDQIKPKWACETQQNRTGEPKSEYDLATCELFSAYKLCAGSDWPVTYTPHETILDEYLNEMIESENQPGEHFILGFP